MISDLRLRLRAVPSLWETLPGNSFPPRSRFWGCLAHVLSRDVLEDPDVQPHPAWSAPDTGVLSLTADAQASVAGWWDGLRAAQPLDVARIWLTADGAFRSYRAELSDGTWVNAGHLRVLAEMTGWPGLWAPDEKRCGGTRFVLLARADRQVLGAVAPVTMPGRPNPEAWGWREVR